MDPYRRLGVKRDASPAALHAAWRREAMRHHPDQGGDPALFRSARDAFEAIRTGRPYLPEGWEAHDAARRAYHNPNGGASRGGPRAYWNSTRPEPPFTAWLLTVWRRYHAIKPYVYVGSIGALVLGAVLAEDGLIATLLARRRRGAADGDGAPRPPFVFRPRPPPPAPS